MENLKESHSKQKKHRRVVLFPLPLKGHLTPMLQVANILYSRGFCIDIIHTHFNSPDHSNFPHFIFHPIPDGLSEVEVTRHTDDGTRVLKIINDNCAEPHFRDVIAKLLSDDSEEPIACLIADPIWSFIPAVAESLKLPWFALVIGNATSLLVANAFPDLHEKGYIPCKSDSLLDELVPEIPHLKVRDLPKFIPELFQMTINMVRATKMSHGIILDTLEELEQSSLTLCRKVFRKPVYHIGPSCNYFSTIFNIFSFLTQDQASISWLDEQPAKSVLYISFGSLITIKESEFLEIAWGLANSKRPFLWVIRGKLIQGSEWIEPLSKEFLQLVSGRGHIMKWAPQKEVLAHPAIGGFWTHCGWNSVLESIIEGVPMILHPIDYDQTMNARVLSDVLKVGVHLEDKKERRDIERAITRLMDEEEGHQIRKTIASFKEKMKSCLRKGGSSYQSMNDLINIILVGTKGK